MPLLELQWGWCNEASAERAGAALRSIRRGRGLTQNDVALHAGCSRLVVMSLEKDLTGRLVNLLGVLKVLELGAVLVPHPPKRRLIPARNLAERDLVMTPFDLAGRLLQHFSPQINGRLLDPARGEGAFFNQFPAACASDWCEISEGRDFLEYRKFADWIITNPPWSFLREFIQHAMTLTENIVFIAPLPNFTTKARLADLRAAGFGIAELVLLRMPKGWPQSGFQLVAAHIRKGYSGAWLVSDLAAGDQGWSGAT